MIKYYDCARPGCGRTVKAQRIEDGKVVEEEVLPGTQKALDGQYYCGPCFEKRQEFMDPKEIMEDGE